MTTLLCCKRYYQHVVLENYFLCDHSATYCNETVGKMFYIPIRILMFDVFKNVDRKKVTSWRSKNNWKRWPHMWIMYKKTSRTVKQALWRWRYEWTKFTWQVCVTGPELQCKALVKDGSTGGKQRVWEKCMTKGAWNFPVGDVYLALFSHYEERSCRPWIFSSHLSSVIRLWGAKPSRVGLCNVD